NRFTNLVKNLTVFEDNMKNNIDKTFGLVYSQRVMLTLIDKGLAREEAYDLVQPKPLESWETKMPFREPISADKRSTEVLSGEEIDGLFDENHHLQRVDIIFRRAALE